MIELRGVTKQYLYGARVLGCTDMTINSGEIVALLGDVASGKTSFLKAVAGVTECEGEVLFDGEPLAKKPDGVVMIFDDLALFPYRNVYYNLAYPLKIRGVSKDEISSAVYDATARVGIGASRFDRVNTLSLIDKKRLALARLLLRPTKAILIDDITCGLTALECETLWGEVAPILLEKAAEGASIIFATSRLSEALSVADRIAVMHAGEIKQFASYDDIVSNPASIWAAQAVESGFAFEKVKIKQCDGSIDAVFEDRYAVDINDLKDRIVKEYLDRDVLAGWRSDSYNVDGERRQQVKYAIRVDGGYILHTDGGLDVLCAQKLGVVGTLPQSGKIFLFDPTNENSILLDK